MERGRNLTIVKRLRARGSWPGWVHFGRYWGRAAARPWSDDSTGASLRLNRGGGRFLEACGRWLLAAGADEVLSPALPEPATKIWRQAGFEPYLALDLYGRSLFEPVPDPSQPVTVAPRPDMVRLAEIDSEAFPSRWRVGRLGLIDALSSTPVAAVLVAGAASRPVGFAVVGESEGVGYLQRLAVEPDGLGHGFGRSLLRAAMQWARSHGAEMMFLNTQPDNGAAVGLYRSEGFEPSQPGLQVLTLRGAAQPGL